MQKVDIPGFEMYSVDSEGNVYSSFTGNVKKPKVNKQGYLVVILYKDHKPYTRHIARLVAQAFLPNPDNKPYIKHLDGNKTNVTLENLEWWSEVRKGRIVSDEQKIKVSKTLMGHYVSEETKKKISAHHGGKNKISRTSEYYKVHRWVVRQLGKPTICELCSTTEAKRFDWSNKSQTYQYDLKDWQGLCRRCHSHYDIKMKTRSAS